MKLPLSTPADRRGWLDWHPAAKKVINNKTSDIIAFLMVPSGYCNLRAWL